MGDGIPKDGYVGAGIPAPGQASGGIMHPLKFIMGIIIDIASALYIGGAIAGGCELAAPAISKGAGSTGATGAWSKLKERFRATGGALGGVVAADTALLFIATLNASSTCWDSAMGARRPA